MVWGSVGVVVTIRIMVTVAVGVVVWGSVWVVVWVMVAVAVVVDVAVAGAVWVAVRGGKNGGYHNFGATVRSNAHTARIVRVVCGTKK